MTKPSFDAQIQPFIGARLAQLQKWIPTEARHILDLGCAFGYISSRLVSSVRQVYGVDPYAPFIEEAHATNPDIPFLVAVGEAIPFKDNFFDCVIMAEVLEHVTDDLRVLQEVHRIIAPGGVLLLTVPHSGRLSFLDLDNITYSFPRAHRYLYRLMRRNCQGFIPKTREHHHYSVTEIEEKLPGNFMVEETYLSGFILDALATLFGSFVRGRAKSPLHSIKDWDYGRQYKGANRLAMRVRKTNF